MNPHITSVRLDGAAEQQGSDATEILNKRGIARQSVAPGASESMGMVERMNRTIKDKITTMLIGLGLEERGELWPWFTAAASTSVNYTRNATGTKCPAELRHEALGSDGVFSLPKFLYGSPVYFTDERNRTNKEEDKLPNGKRLGLFLAQEHSGCCEVLGVQRQRLVIWVVHPNSVSKADDSVLPRLMRRLNWAATGYDDRDLRVISAMHREKAGTEQVFSYPYKMTSADFSLSDSESEDGQSEDVLPRRLRRLARNGAASFYSISVSASDGNEYVGIAPPAKCKIPVAKISNGYVTTPSEPLVVDYGMMLRKGKNAILRSDGRVLPLGVCRRAGGKGHFHVKYGYVADDEADPKDVDAGVFEAADLKEFSSLVENNVLGPEVMPNNLPAGARACRTRFRRTYKTSALLEVVPKSRFLVCETKDDRDVPISTEMPAAWIRRLVVVIGLSRGWKAATIDIKTAFLLVTLPPEHGDVYVRLPNTLPRCVLELGYRPGAIHKLNKS